MVDTADEQFGGGSPEPDTEAIVEKIRNWVENRRAEWQEFEWLDLVTKLYEDGHAVGMSRKSLEDIRDSEKKAWLRAEKKRKTEERVIAETHLRTAEEAELKQKAAEQARKRRQEEQLFEEIRSSPTIGLCKRYLKQYLEGRYPQDVNETLNRLQNRRKNLLQTAKKTALLIAFLASVYFIGFIAIKTLGREKEANVRILWITEYEDPRTGGKWGFETVKASTVFCEFFQSIKDVDGAIDFKKSSDLKTEYLASAYDILILLTYNPDDFKTADEFVKSGKDVVVLADYFRCNPEGHPYSEIANREFLNRFDILIEPVPKPSYKNLRLRPGKHPVSSDITDIFIKSNSGCRLSCSGRATEVLYRNNDNKPWAAVWDGHDLDQGRVLVIPDTAFWWGNCVYARGRDHFKFWRQALRWLKVGQTGK